jgi:membrane-bound lytic murein transglycosylase F
LKIDNLKFSRPLRRKAVFLLILLVSQSHAAPGPKKFTTAYDQYFRKYSKHYFGVGFDWRWFKAQAIAESNLNDKAESWVSAKGLMQIMPATFADIQKRNPDFIDILDPRWNIAAGIYYDRILWKMWKAIEALADHLSFMFGAYNAGSSTIQRAQTVAKEKGHNDSLWVSIVQIAPEVPRWRHQETLGYVEKIHALVDEVEK